MEFYKLALCLLLCSQQLWAASYWSHIPEVGSVQLTELTTAQHQAVALHLQLSTEQTTEWLNNLPALLDSLSCATIDSQSQPVPGFKDASYKLVSYAGVLKLFTDAKAENTLWWLPWSLLPVLSQLQQQLAEMDTQLHQPLLITEQQLGTEDQLIIVSGSSVSPAVYFALRLDEQQRIELLWSLDATVAGFADLAGSAAQPLLMLEPREQPALPALSVLLANTAQAATKTLLYKIDMMTGRLQSRLAATQDIAGLSGALVLYDHDRDTVSDSLLFSTKSGQLWQVQLEEQQFHTMQTVADLSMLNLSDVQFIRTLYAAVPVGGSGSDFHSRRSQWLVVLAALRQQNTVLVVLKPSSDMTSSPPDLVDRTLPGSPELALLTPQDWQHIQQKHGWFSQLNGRLTQPPLVAAGVVYLNLLKQNLEQLCSAEQSSSALTALHLHHGSAVYRQPSLPLVQAAGSLKVKANEQGGFSLIDPHSQQVLIEQMLEISPDCTHCSKAIRQDSFPRWQLMGTYHNEEGVYE